MLSFMFIILCSLPQPIWPLGDGQPLLIHTRTDMEYELVTGLGVNYIVLDDRNVVATCTADKMQLLTQCGIEYMVLTRQQAFRLIQATNQLKQQYPAVVWIDYPPYADPGDEIDVTVHFSVNVPPNVDTIGIIVYKRATRGAWEFDFVLWQDVEVPSPPCVLDTSVTLTYSLPDTFEYVHEYVLGIGYGDYWTWWWYFINNVAPRIHQNVAVLVDSSVYGMIDTLLEQYKLDVESQFDASLYIFVDSWSDMTAEAIRGYLQTLYVDSGITGAILVGNLPYALWEHPRQVEPPYCLPYFYEDLDGTFVDGDNDGYYEQKIEGDHVGPEIWVFWMWPPADEPERLVGYLQKCHTYYQHELHVPRQALECICYDWRGAAKPMYISLSHIYGEAVDTIGGMPDWYVSGSEYLEYLNTYGSEITHIWCHSGSSVHCFDRWPWVYWSDVREISPGSWFYLLWACHGASFHDEPSHNLAINYCMGESNGLGALGVTRSIGTGNAQETFFNLLSAGKTLGEAFYDYLCYQYDTTWIKVWFTYWGDETPDSFTWDLCFIGNPFVTFPGTLEGPPSAPKDVTISPGYFKLNLSWRRNYEDDVIGYNVYRGETSGGPYNRINNELVDTFFTDTMVESGVWYYYVVTAVDTQGLESDYSVEVTGRCISLDHGILLVDETRNGTGAPCNPTDEQVDSFYHALLDTYEYDEWDIDSDGMPTIYDCGIYGIIIWYADDYAAPHLHEVVDELKLYLDAGGKLIISGWKPIYALTGETYPSEFEPGDFVYDYFKIAAADESGWADFVGADGCAGYPDLEVDSSKVLSTWHGNMKYIDVFTTVGAQPIYTFRSASGDTAFDGKICGIEYTGGPHKVILLGFPLYYMEEDSAKRFMQHAIAEFTGVEEVALDKLELLQNYPNPFIHGTTIKCVIPNGRVGKLTIYDVTGRVVRSYTVGSGLHTIYWDGTSTTGREVPPGIYFYVMDVDSKQLVHKMVKLR